MKCYLSQEAFNIRMDKENLKPALESSLDQSSCSFILSFSSKILYGAIATEGTINSELFISY